MVFLKVGRKISSRWTVNKTLPSSIFLYVTGTLTLYQKRENAKIDGKNKKKKSAKNILISLSFPHNFNLFQIFTLTIKSNLTHLVFFTQKC